jgi:HAMP domain-containing protein/HPt (histidine-containing phosphotransfer) domain-containing protein
MAAVILLVSVGIFFEVSRREQASMLRAKTAEASAVADLFAASVSAGLDFGDADAVRAELKNLESSRDLVYAAAWSTSADEPVAELRRAGAERPPRPASLEGTLVETHASVEVTRPVRNPRKNLVGATLLRFSLASENLAFGDTQRTLFWMCVGMATGTVALLVLLARRQIVTPIGGLLRAARKVQRGDADAEVAVRGNDEIARLGRAFNDMSAAIRDREGRLAAANKSLSQLFDSMRQAIVVFGADGRAVATASRSAVRLFEQGDDARSIEATAPPRVAIDGASVVDLLYGARDTFDAEREAFAQWVELAFAAPSASWADVAELAPREVTLRAVGGERALELEFRPIFGDDDVEGAPSRVMLLATDVTASRELEREVRTKGAAHEREMAAARQLLVGRGDAFVSFLTQARERFERCVQLVAVTGGSPTGAALDELLQHAHTVKGEARAFDLEELASAVRSFEQQLQSAHGGPKPEADVIARGLEAATDALERAAALFVRVSPLGAAALDRVPVRRSDVARLVELTAGRGDEIAAVVERLGERPFGECATILAEKVPTWAAELGKRAGLVLEGRDVPVPAPLARVLTGVLTHLVRNAVAHGVEPPAEREAKGKPAAGLVRVACTAAAGGPVIVIEDDGPGFDAAAITARAREQGEADATAPAEELIFAPRISTRPEATDAAGLGVGLAAVRADLRAAGYAIRASRREGAGARFVISIEKPG